MTAYPTNEQIPLDAITYVLVSDQWNYQSKHSNKRFHFTSKCMVEKPSAFCCIAHHPWVFFFYHPRLVCWLATECWSKSLSKLLTFCYDQNLWQNKETIYWTYSEFQSACMKKLVTWLNLKLNIVAKRMNWWIERMNQWIDCSQ